MLSRENIESFSIDVEFLSEKKKETRIRDELLKLTLEDYKKLTYDFSMMGQAIEKLPSVIFQSKFITMTVSEHAISIEVNKNIKFPEIKPDGEVKNLAFSEESINKISNDLNYLIGILTARLGSITTKINIFLDVRTDFKTPRVENCCFKNDFKKKINKIFEKEQIKLTGLKIESIAGEINKEYIITEHLEKESNNTFKFIYKSNYIYEFIPVDVNVIINESLNDVYKMIKLLGVFDDDSTK